MSSVMLVFVFPVCLCNVLFICVICACVFFNCVCCAFQVVVCFYCLSVCVVVDLFGCLFVLVCVIVFVVC